jgi:exodeoxyribonuclease V alpha subunit
LEKVILLNPQRQNTSVSVDAFNKELQERLNPPSADKKEVVVSKKTFRTGDKVIELKNTEFAKNGDTGYIIDVFKRADDPENKLDFNYYCVIEWNGGNAKGGTTVEYSMDDMKHVDLAYCMTVHKSQGSEYDTVIEIVSKAHSSMLKRNLVYTGITRAKKDVILIGELDALEMSIRNDRAENRYTNLAARIYCS